MLTTFNTATGQPKPIAAIEVIAIKQKLVGDHLVTKFLMSDGRVLTHDEWPLDQLKDTDLQHFLNDLGWTRLEAKDFFGL